MADNPTIKLLQEMYEQGEITKETFEARIQALGIAPATIFDQQQQALAEQRLPSLMPLPTETLHSGPLNLCFLGISR